MTLAAKVDNKNGTEETIATTANIFERVLPEPPKRDFTLPLNGEFKDIFIAPRKFHPTGNRGRYYAKLEPKFKTEVYFLPILTGILTVFKSIPSAVIAVERVICASLQSSKSVVALLTAATRKVMAEPAIVPAETAVIP